MARATAIGLMSGTSYEGGDVALIETDGEEIGRLGPTGYRPYSDPEREVVRRAIAVAANLTDRSGRAARDRGSRHSHRPQRPAGDARRSRGAGDRHACRGGRGIPGGQRHAAER